MVIYIWSQWLCRTIFDTQISEKYSAAMYLLLVTVIMARQRKRLAGFQPTFLYMRSLGARWVRLRRDVSTLSVFQKMKWYQKPAGRGSTNIHIQYTRSLGSWKGYEMGLQKRAPWQNTFVWKLAFSAMNTRNWRTTFQKLATENC